MNNNSLYIIKVPEDGELFEYQYHSLRSANDHYDFEKSCYMYEYDLTEKVYHFVKAK